MIFRKIILCFRIGNRKYLLNIVIKNLQEEPRNRFVVALQIDIIPRIYNHGVSRTSHNIIRHTGIHTRLKYIFHTFQITIFN